MHSAPDQQPDEPHSTPDTEPVSAPATYDARSYWDKRLGKRWSLHGVGMVKLSHRYNRWMYRVRRAAFRRMVRTAGVHRAGAHALDIGSGTGYYVHLWSKLGVGRLCGVDIADSAVARLRRRFPAVTFERADVSESLPFAEHTFDAVSALDVLFHITDDDRYRHAIANIHRVLAPGGWFVFSEHLVPETKRGAKHYVSRSRSEIEAMLRETGFEIVARRPVFVLMGPPYSPTSARRAALWSKVIAPIAARERWGGLLGAALWPVELALTGVRRETACSQIMLCRKPGA